MSEWKLPPRSGKAAVFKPYRVAPPAGRGGARDGAGRKSRAEIMRPAELLSSELAAAAGDAFGAWLLDWLSALDDPRLVCGVCGGVPDAALHPRGFCYQAFRGLDLTCADVERASRAKSTRSRKIVEQVAPPVPMVVDGVRKWMSRQSCALFGFMEYGGTKSGVRGALGQLNIHAHLVGRGWLCEIEEARLDWHLGYAHGGDAQGIPRLFTGDDDVGVLLPFECDAAVRLRSLYVAKHSGKFSGGVDLLPVFRKNVGIGGVEQI